MHGGPVSPRAPQMSSAGSGYCNLPCGNPLAVCSPGNSARFFQVHQDGGHSSEHHPVSLPVRFGREAVSMFQKSGAEAEQIS